MKYILLTIFKTKAICLSILCSLGMSSCAGQIENKFSQLYFIPEQTKIHADSISLKAETLPEYRVDVHDKDYQGNQISGVVRTVLQDSKGNFWFGTQNGLCRKDKNGLVYFDLKALAVNAFSGVSGFYIFYDVWEILSYRNLPFVLTTCVIHRDNVLASKTGHLVQGHLYLLCHGPQVNWSQIGGFS